MEELNVEQIESVAGGRVSVSRMFVDFAVGQVLDAAWEGLKGGFSDWANAGAGIGGRMDRESKLG